jgi:predicted  nucleic acid-binding Zn-ribbon protein
MTLTEKLYVEKLIELNSIQGMAISYFRKYSGESERITRFMESIHKVQDEIAELKSQIGKEPETIQQIRDKVITGSYNIDNEGLKSDPFGWEHYARKLEKMIIEGSLI